MDQGGKPLSGEAGIENAKLIELQARVDALCREVLRGIELKEFFSREKNLKNLAAALFPEKMELYNLIYRSRFKRFWEQFRNLKIEFKEE